MKDCPTKDNVFISIDMAFNFHIGDRSSKEALEVDCKKFLYQLGPNRLQEMLEDTCEEQIRQIVRKTRVS